MLNRGYEIDRQSFLDKDSWDIFYKKGHFLKKVLGLTKGYLRRLLVLFRVGKYEYVFIHREVAPIGPPVFEWLISKVWKKKIIYDFDDAIWISNSSDNNRFFSPLKWYSNAFRICKWSYKVSAGNQFLADSVAGHNMNVVVNPTTIDTGKHHRYLTDHSNEIPVIGWTGSHSTVKYLDLIFPLLEQLRQELDFRLVIISDEQPVHYRHLFEFKPWNKTREIEDLMQFNIGIMPLTKDPWSEGKCGFKALQYMSLGIPALVSPVGVNENIVDEGINGFICRNNSEWADRIRQLVEDRKTCLKMGKAARLKVVQEYSVEANTANFLNLFS